MMVFFHFLAISFLVFFQVSEEKNYFQYYRQVIRAEELICSENFSEALDLYDDLFENYDFVFLHEYKVASRIAIFLGEQDKAKELVQKGILGGWEFKSSKSI